MALTINTNIKNDANGYSLDSNQIKGGYFSVGTISERDQISSAVIDNGSYCFVRDDNTFYIYKNGVWEKATADPIKYSADDVTLQLSNNEFSLKSVPLQYLEDSADYEIFLDGGNSSIG